MIKNKLKASAIHLAISAFIIGCFLLFTLTIWYPEPFFTISGLQHIILILISIDIILGPLLTFIVFKPQKASLKFDLTIIGFIQIIALSYGIHTIYESHPLYIAYAIDRFTPINANEVNPEKATYDELKKSTINGPSLVYVQKPDDPAEMSRVTMEVLSGKPDLDARPEYYKPIQNFMSKIMANSIPIEKLQSNTANKEQLDNFLNKNGKNIRDYAFLALSGKEKDVIWVFDRQNSKPIGVIDINPFNL